MLAEWRGYQVISGECSRELLLSLIIVVPAVNAIVRFGDNVPPPPQIHVFARQNQRLWLLNTLSFHTAPWKFNLILVIMPRKINH